MKYQGRNTDLTSTDRIFCTRKVLLTCLCSARFWSSSTERHLWHWEMWCHHICDEQTPTFLSFTVIRSLKGAKHPQSPLKVMSLNCAFGLFENCSFSQLIVNWCVCSLAYRKLVTKIYSKVFHFSFPIWLLWFYK